MSDRMSIITDWRVNEDTLPDVQPEAEYECVITSQKGCPRSPGQSVVIKPAFKAEAFAKTNDVEHVALSLLSCFVGCPQAALPPQAAPSDSHGVTALLRH